jgi:peptide/nickel transport system ATP-binding protein
MAETLLSVENLRVVFGPPGREQVAVDGVSFTLAPGEVIGIVGESGSGKSLTALSILRLVPSPPGRISAGRIGFRDRNLLELGEGAMNTIRGAEIAMIFQEPMTALNPVLPIRLQIEESLQAHTSLDGPARRARALELMNIVGIPAAERRLDEFPHQFSGGMRQRAMIAIALASSPKLLLADEPTTALDVTIQDQILKLILDLRDRLGMSVLFVTHDLGVVAATCDRMTVMYAGRVVETGTVAKVFATPHHPYTRGLLGSVPSAGAERRMLLSIEGTPPSLLSLPAGCAFHPRCAFAVERCRAERPALEAVAAGREVACFRHLEVAAMTEAA